MAIPPSISICAVPSSTTRSHSRERINAADVDGLAKRDRADKKALGTARRVRAIVRGMEPGTFSTGELGRQVLGERAMAGDLESVDDRLPLDGDRGAPRQAELGGRQRIPAWRVRGGRY